MSKALALTLLSVVLAVLAAGCGGTSEGSEGGAGGKLSLVAYSTPKEAYEELIPAFRRTPRGEGVGFDQSYGSSGEQQRAVEGGLPADIVALSLEPDVTKLVDAGLVAEDWNRDRYDGFVTRSVVVFAVRKGNPKHIRTWDDLVRDDVEVITPNPFTSGGARWNVMAAFGAKTTRGGSEEQGLDFVRAVLENTPVQDKSAREALQTFAGGKGDVLIAYENEAITAQQKGEEIDYVVPDETILIENPIAVVKGSRNAGRARAFVDFLRTPGAQRIFAEKGYRSVLPEVVDRRRFPQPRGLFTIDDLGGWAEVTDRFFDSEQGLVAEIERELGVSTAD